MPGDLDVIYVVSPNLTDEKAAAAREALHNLARTLGRASAKACHELGIEPDMDNPEVAKEIMIATLEALVFTKPAKRRKKPDKSAG